MTRRAIDVQLAVQALAPGRYLARATVRNIGAGHHFPTYMVPKVELHFVRVDHDGRRTEVGRQLIGWSVDTAITREIEDTRIPPGRRAASSSPSSRRRKAAGASSCSRGCTRASTTSAPSATA
ncbi:MAG: hypothetical protein U1F49_14445 [Rubrivivax sp.]